MAWSSSDRRAHLPRGWARLRAKVLERDGHRCQIRGPGCTIHATEVDHIVNGDIHEPSNLQAACSPCHASKSAREGMAARADIAAMRWNPVRPHPGMLG